MPIEPRNFHRSFATSCRKAGVRLIPVHATRKALKRLGKSLDTKRQAQ